MLDENSLISPRNWAISHIVADSGTVYRGQQVRIRTCCHRCTAARYHLLPEAPLWCDIDRNSSRQLRLFDQVRLACQRHYYSPRTASCRQRTYLAHGAVVPSRQHEGQLMAETSVQRPATSAYAALQPFAGRPASGWNGSMKPVRLGCTVFGAEGLRNLGFRSLLCKLRQTNVSVRLKKQAA